MVGENCNVVTRQSIATLGEHDVFKASSSTAANANLKCSELLNYCLYMYGVAELMLVWSLRSWTILEPLTQFLLYDPIEKRSSTRMTGTRRRHQKPLPHELDKPLPPEGVDEHRSKAQLIGAAPAAVDVKAPWPDLARFLPVCVWNIWNVFVCVCVCVCVCVKRARARARACAPWV